MAAPNTGGPAFPSNRDMRHSPDWDYEPGMNLRDYFAIHATDADMRRWLDEGFPRVRARYAFADQMLAFRASGHSDL